MQETGNHISIKRKFIDNSFQAEIPEKYDLYIFVSEEELSCVVADKQSKKFIGLESWNILDSSTSLQDIHENSTLLAPFNYRKVICCSGFRNATLVPAPLFENGTASEQLYFANQRLENGQVLIDDLRQLEAKNVFSIPGSFISEITGWFREVQFHHTSTALIEYIITANKNRTDELMNVNVHGSFIEIVVTKSRQLLLYNYFNYATPEEMVYYILFVCEQLHLNPEHIHVCFAGDIETEDSAFYLSSKYIRNLSLAARPEVFGYSEVLRQIPSHFHFNLFSQVICEL